MFQAKIEDRNLTITHKKNGNISDTVMFLEQQFGKKLSYRNRTYYYPTTNGSVCFLAKDEDFANLLAESLGFYTSSLGE